MLFVQVVAGEGQREGADEINPDENEIGDNTRSQGGAAPQVPPQ